MKYLIFCFVILISILSVAFPYETFIRSINIPFGAIPLAAIELNDGGFAIGGYFFYMRIDSMGNVVYSRQFGRFEGEQIFDFCEYNDSAIYGAGRYFSEPSILKFDELMDLELAEKLHFDWSAYNDNIVTSADNLILVTGTNMIDSSYVLKLNPIRLNVEWVRIIGLSLTHGMYGIWRTELVATSDSGAFVANTFSVFYTIPSILGALALVKFDEFGNIEWTRFYNYTGFLTCYTALPDGNGFILGGSHLESDIALLFLDSLGNIKRAYTIGDTSSFMCEMAISMVRDDDSSIVILSAANDISPVTGQKDILVLKVDTLGNVRWAYTIGGPADEIPVELIKCSSGGFLAVGITTTYPYGDSSILVVRLDEDGRTSCIQKPYFPMVVDCTDSIDSLPFIVTVSASSCSTSEFTLTVNSMPFSVINPCSTFIVENNRPLSEEIKINPNPFNNSCFIDIPVDAELVITDICGRSISNGIKNLGNGKYLWQPEKSMPSGVYIVNVVTDFEVFRKKVLFLK